MNKIYSHIASVFVFTILLISTSAVRAALIDSVTVTPDLKTTNSPLIVEVKGTFPLEGFSILSVTNVRDAGGYPHITITIQSPTGDAAPVPTPYSVSHDIGLFAESDYVLFVDVIDQYGRTLATMTDTIWVIGCTSSSENPLAPIVCNIPTLGVLTNHTVDWKPVIEDPRTTGPITCRIDTPPIFGSATVASDCSTGTYTVSSLNDEEFTYRAFNGVAESLPAMVSVQVSPNSAPYAYPSGGAGLQDTVIAWTPWVVDLNDVDVAQLRCRIVQPSTDGTLTVADDCSSGTFTPNPGFIGGATGTYAVTDGDLESAPATIGIAVNQLPTACMLANPSRTLTLGAGKGTEGTLWEIFTGYIVKGDNKSVTICPGTKLQYVASAPGMKLYGYFVTCQVNAEPVNTGFGTVSGWVKTGDRISCTNKAAPDDPDTTFDQGRDTDTFTIKN